jgi:hypothetical protein
LRGIPAVTAELDSALDMGPFVFHFGLHAKPADDKSALVVSQQGSATSSSRYHSTRFPRLRVEVYSHDEMSAYRILGEVDDALHAPWTEQWWGDFRVIDCMRLSEADAIETPWWHGLHAYSDFSVVIG